VGVGVGVAVVLVVDISLILGSNFYLSVTIYVLYFTRRISIVTAVRFVIVDFKGMNEMN